MSFRVTGEAIVLFARPRGADAEEALSAPAAVEPALPVMQERESKRVSITGNVASVPTYAPLPKKGLRVGFVLAEHLEDGVTHFHHVYATGEYARRVQAKNPLKGTAVTVEGERQVNERLVKGTPTSVEELYCYGLRVTVRPRRNRRPDQRGPRLLSILHTTHPVACGQQAIHGRDEGKEVKGECPSSPRSLRPSEQHGCSNRGLRVVKGTATKRGKSAAHLPPR